ncbi:MAG: nucleotidyltransferase family protein [Anaerolineales bacterium]|uniref:nucleotidyltransferase family protein n=1 Tax=Candidatus Villigracilis proximus TaxID=3140683 RepID=UPI0031352E69|nr:nucleotidyltransferase family protein [Anaerolineales bacterium]
MITAIILAAGESKRMGEPKMLMPWGKSTVLQTVISTFQSAGLNDILVVTGGARQQVESLIGKTVQTIFNDSYDTGEMLSSIQVGLSAKMREASAALICLGDQPQVNERTVRSICDAFLKNKSAIVVPSYEMQRGHPWLVARPLWEDLLEMKAPRTPRDFLKKYARKIHYVNVDTHSILEDLDTPEDYSKHKS